MPQSVFSWCFRSVSKYFLALFDIWAKNRIFEPRTGFKKKLKYLKTCLGGVFWVFQGILALFDIYAENRIFEPRTGFSKIYKRPQNMFSWCFMSVSRYFSIVRNLSREPDKPISEAPHAGQWCTLLVPLVFCGISHWETKSHDPITRYDTIKAPNSKTEVSICFVSSRTKKKKSIIRCFVTNHECCCNGIKM